MTEDTNTLRPQGNAIRRNFPGMQRACTQCGGDIIVTEQMCKRGTYQCGKCRSVAAGRWARNNRDRKRQANREWHASHPVTRARASRLYRERHPEKKAAHHAVQTALRNGTLVRLPCMVCGAENAHAHHEDYARPLAVDWLCHRHHMERHAEMAERAKSSPAPDLLEVANYVADMTYCGADAEWHFKPGYDPQRVLDAISKAEGLQSPEKGEDHG